MKEFFSKENRATFNQDVNKYLDTQVTLWKVIMVEKLSEFGSYVLTSVSLILVLLFCCFLFSLGFAFWYGNHVGPVYIGFFWASGIFILIGALIAIFRKKLFTNHVMRFFVSLFFENDKSNN